MIRRHSRAKQFTSSWPGSTETMPALTDFIFPFFHSLFHLELQPAGWYCSHSENVFPTLSQSSLETPWDHTRWSALLTSWELLRPIKLINNVSHPIMCCPNSSLGAKHRWWLCQEKTLQAPSLLPLGISCVFSLWWLWLLNVHNRSQI